MSCSGICAVVGVVRRYRLLVVATVLVLQALEGLSDREAIGRLRCDIRWKAAAGLALTDEGFHPTVLTLWRARLRRSSAPERVCCRVVVVGCWTRRCWTTRWLPRTR